MGKNDNQWERHNAPNGEHVWQGDKHMADITGNNESILAEISKFAVIAHNACIKINPDNPLAVAKSIDKMYESWKYILDRSVQPWLRELTFATPPGLCARMTIAKHGASGIL